MRDAHRFEFDFLPPVWYYACASTFHKDLRADFVLTNPAFSNSRYGKTQVVAAIS